MLTGSIDMSGAKEPADNTRRIRAAAQEFEAAMINAWWQAMQGTFMDKDGAKLTGDSGVLGDLSRQTMATAIAEAGGIGFATMVAREVGEAAARRAQVSSSPADL